MSEDLVKQARAWDFCWPSKDIQRLVPAMADRIEELEAKLAKAVEGLKRLADCVDDGCFCSEMAMATAMDTARATLAELTGGKDE
jgi:hypothetical protein